MGRLHDTVTFLSDLGTVDERVGVVKAVIRDLAPHAQVIDLTHGIPPFDARAGGLALARAVPYLPAGVVLAIVDPGEGTSRRAVAIEVAGGAGVFVGPDNGVLAPAVAMAGGAERCVELTSTAHHLVAPGIDDPGTVAAWRDVFAAVAAHLCNGVDLDELGDPVDAELLLPGVVPLPREQGDGLACEVLVVDRFGNCQLNAGPDDLAALGVVRVGDRVRIVAGDAALPGGPVVRVAERVDAYADVVAGAVGLVVDGSGMCSLVLDRRSAAEELSLATGDQVVLTPLGDDDRPGVTSPVTLRTR